MPTASLEVDERADIEAACVVHGSARVGRSDEHGAALDEEARGVLADGAEALHGDPSALQRRPAVPRGNLGGGRDPEARCTDLIERYAADLARQPDAAADLVLDPAHRRLVRAHVGTDDEMGQRPDR